MGDSHRWRSTWTPTAGPRPAPRPPCGARCATSAAPGWTWRAQPTASSAGPAPAASRSSASTATPRSAPASRSPAASPGTTPRRRSSAEAVGGSLALALARVAGVPAGCPQIGGTLFWPVGRGGRLRPPHLPHPKGTAVPTPDRGLLARLDTLVELVADRHGLALLPDGRLAAGEARVAARAAGLTTPRGPGGPAPGGTQREAVELLRAVAEGVGLLRVRSDRLEATSLRHAWAQIDPGLRSGLVYAAWCHRVPWPAFLRGPGLEALVGGRLWVLRLLLGLPAGVEVGLQGLVETVANGLELDLDEWLPRALAAAFLDPLVALGVADTRPPPPHPGSALRLGPRASTVIGSALVAAGEEVSLASTPSN